MILVLTAGFGDGHNTAARSVAEALGKLSPGEEVKVSDFITEVHPRLASFLKGLYQFAIINWPASWRFVYTYLAEPEISEKPPAWQVMLLKVLAERVSTLQPRLIVSTYPLYAELVERLRTTRPMPPLVTIITDSVSVHPIWLSAPSDRLCVADEETREVVQKLGVKPERCFVTGFPVNLAFTNPPAPTPDSDRQRILYLPSTSVRWFGLTLESLRPLLAKGVHLTIPVGKHASRLYHTLRRFIDSMPDASIEIIGWTQRMPELLQTHDVLISKAGGAILHEVLAARCPVVIDYVVPGQEEGNANLLLDHNCALRSLHPAETGKAVARLLADDGKLGKQFRENMRTLSVPDAALKAATCALEIASPLC